MSAASAFSIAAGFAMAFAGWLTIYFAVQTRRKRDALQLELAVVARDAQLNPSARSSTRIFSSTV